MKRTLTIAHLILTTAAVYMGVHLFYRLVEAKLDRIPVRDTYPTTAAADSSSPVPPLSSYQAIIQRNLFKIQEEKQPPPAKEVSIDQLKQTDLQLKLWGTVIDDDGKAYAVIEDSAKREQKLYLAGDMIQNASVKRILREKVILYVEGKDEILSMEKIESSPAGRSARPPMRAPGSAVSPARTQKIVLNKSQLGEMLENVDGLMQQARFRPHFEDGKPDGISLTGIRPNSIFRKMGLRNGDILMGVNETDIRSVDDAARLYRDLSSTTSATIQIKRRGRLQTLEYTIQ